MIAFERGKSGWGGPVPGRLEYSRRFPGTHGAARQNNCWSVEETAHTGSNPLEFLRARPGQGSLRILGPLL